MLGIYRKVIRHFQETKYQIVKYILVMVMKKYVCISYISFRLRIKIYPLTIYNEFDLYKNCIFFISTSINILFFILYILLLNKIRAKM